MTATRLAPLPLTHITHSPISHRHIHTYLHRHIGKSLVCVHMLTHMHSHRTTQSESLNLTLSHGIWHTSITKRDKLSTTLNHCVDSKNALKPLLTSKTHTSCSPYPYWVMGWARLIPVHKSGGKHLSTSPLNLVSTQLHKTHMCTQTQSNSLGWLCARFTAKEWSEYSHFCIEYIQADWITPSEGFKLLSWQTPMPTHHTTMSTL